MTTTFKVLAAMIAVGAGLFWLRGRQGSTVPGTGGAHTALPDLTRLNDKQLAGHGDIAAFTWFSERERVKQEWMRRGKAYMARIQEEKEREADRINNRALDHEADERSEID